MKSKKQHIASDVFDITALIRSIQRVEANFDCFQKAKGYCDKSDCY
jgi:hypothetical protein